MSSRGPQQESPHSESGSYQFALGSMMGETVTELRNLHHGTVMELRTLRTETVTELRALQGLISKATNLVHQILREQKATKGSGLMAQLSTLLKLLLPYAVLVTVVAGKLSLKDFVPILRTYLQSLGVM